MDSMVNGKNGKWQLAFWLITVICGIWLLTLSNGVVANDRMRASEDKEIKQEMAQDRKELNTILSKMASQLSSIETKIEIYKKGR